MKNVTIVNNTVYGHPTCLSIGWSAASNMVLANNAVYCAGATAVAAAGLNGATITVRANYFTGGLSGAAIDNSRFFSGGAAASAFTNPATLDFWPPPASILIGKADAGFAPTLDFNERSRLSPFGVGGYETDGLATNPGWKIVPGFKGIGGTNPLPPTTPTNLQLR
jgi:hypothetical protein